MNFKEKIVLITGAASGIGRATALLFADKGATIMVSDVNEAGGAETVQMIEAKGQKAAFCYADVADATSVKNMIHQTIETFGQLDIAINNAGIAGDEMKMTHEYSVEEYHRVIAINQTGVFYCMQEELRYMHERQSGCIINVASIAGLRAQPLASAYVASKHAVNGFTKVAALEYARFNIRVNAVCPVFTITPMVKESIFAKHPDYEKKLVRGIPMRRYGQPEDIANAIVWLCADETGYITGHCLPVDGGMMA